MKTLAMLCLPLLAGCATTTAGYFPERPARIGQTVYVGGPTVRPIAITEDSRCPTDVVCVWAGRVVLRAEVGAGRRKYEIELPLGMPVRIADGELTLREVTPAPHSRKPIKPRDYRFTFEFKGGI